MRPKEQIRQKVWSVMQREKVARFPGAQGRIPNFIGAEVCARLLAEKPY
jgi:5-formyltetrahydrofolate cyclo-ligase